jgi:DNA-binding transcriptional LysR family regulator
MAGGGADAIGSLRRRIGLRLPHLVALPTIVASSDLVATVPEHLAAAFLATVDIKILAYPIHIAELTIKQFWHERYHDDPANSWLHHSFTALSQNARSHIRFSD